MVHSTLSAPEWIDPTLDSDWDSDVALEVEASPFETAEWAAVLKESYGHVPFFRRANAEGEQKGGVAMMEVNSRITGRRGVALPFADFCRAFGKLDADAFDSICALGRERNWKSVEFRGAGNVPKDATPSEEYYGHELDLRAGRKVSLGYTRAARAGIRRARESGVIATVETSPSAMREYYALHERTRRRHGAPPQPVHFFANLQKQMLDRGMGFIVLARVERRAISGSVFLIYQTRAVYKYGATDLSEQAKRPSNLVMATAIDHLIDRGAESLHFGRTSLGQEGLRFYKSAWGAQEEILQYFQYDLTSERWMKAPNRLPGICAALFRHLPVALNRAIGAIVYPHLD